MTLRWPPSRRHLHFLANCQQARTSARLSRGLTRNDGVNDNIDRPSQIAPGDWSSGSTWLGRKSSRTVPCGTPAGHTFLVDHGDPQPDAAQVVAQATDDPADDQDVVVLGRTGRSAASLDIPRRKGMMLRHLHAPWRCLSSAYYDQFRSSSRSTSRSPSSGNQPCGSSSFSSRYQFHHQTRPLKRPRCDDASGGHGPGAQLHENTGHGAVAVRHRSQVEVAERSRSIMSMTACSMVLAQVIKPWLARSAPLRRVPRPCRRLVD